MLNQLLSLTRPLILYDLETTSSDVETARIVQMAFRLHKPDADAVEYHTLIDPLVEIPKASSEVHGITDEVIRIGCAKCRAPRESHPHERCPEWKQIPTFRMIGPRIHSGFVGCDLSGYNVHFDIGVLDNQLQKECNLRLQMDDVRIIDPHRLWQVMKPRNLSAAYEEFTGKKPENAHDALHDIRMTEEVLVGQLQRWIEVPRGLDALHNLLWPGDRIDYEGKFIFNEYGEPCFGFGKHRGQPMRLNIDYLRWMQKQGNWSSTVTRIIADALQGRFPVKKESSGDYF